MKIAILALALCAFTPTLFTQSEPPKPAAPATPQTPPAKPPTSAPSTTTATKPPTAAPSATTATKPPEPAKPQDPAKPAANPTAKPGDPAAKPDEPGPAAAATAFTPEQLEQIVAPIALHPDALLAQILMASTYPLEIVEAHRWVVKNSSLTGKPLEEALKKQDWDPSVKSMCGLPSVLKQMNDSLDWTQDLGDAFLGQKAELMQTVQKMRKKALEAGTLKSSEQQKVSEEGQVVVIESTKTDVVYVPTYYPTAVYGSWSYPYYYYPPMYPPYPAGGALFGFAVGVAWAGCWGGCNWGGNDVNIDIDRYNNFNKNTNINPNRDNLQRGAGNNKASFNHNPEHRKGANYKNPQTAQKYGGSGASNRVTKDQARGYDRSGTNRAGGSQPRPSAGNSARPSAGTTPRPSAGTTPRPSAGTTPRPSAGTTRPSSGSGSALSGSRSPSADRSASSRGASSRGSSGASRGGGGRGGGGRGGGGRR
jgi:uncharacterized membrane protein YgcG